MAARRKARPWAVARRAAHAGRGPHRAAPYPAKAAPRTQCARGRFFVQRRASFPNHSAASGLKILFCPECPVCPARPQQMDAVNGPAEGKAAGNPHGSQGRARFGCAAAGFVPFVCPMLFRDGLPFSPARPARADRAGRPNAAPLKMAPLPRPGRKAPLRARAGKAPGAYCAAFSKGNCTVMAVPTPTWLPAKAARQCPQRCGLTMARPRPVPPSLSSGFYPRGKSARTRRSRCCSAMPMPVSRTQRRAPAGVPCTVTVTLPFSLL